MNQALPLEIIQKLSPLELEFAQLWEDRHPTINLVAQYPFGRYRADFCHPQAKVVNKLPALTSLKGWFLHPAQ